VGELVRLGHVAGGIEVRKVDLQVAVDFHRAVAGHTSSSSP